MTWWRDLAIALALAAGLAAAGKLALWKASRGIFALNEAFLAGLGVVAALLFPFSLLFGRAALTALLALLVLSLPAAFFTRRLRPVSDPSPAGGWWRPATPSFFLFAFAAAAGTAAFFLLNRAHSLLWDGFVVWSGRAELLYFDGRVGRDWFPSFDTGFGRLASYPALLPLFEALHARLRGSFDFLSVKPLFLFFHLSTLLSIYRAARRFAEPRLAAAACALVALLPAFTATTNAGGYADLPEAACVAAALAALVWASDSDAASSRAAAVLIGSIAFVKREGVDLAAAMMACVAAAWLGRGAALVPARLRRHAPQILIVAAMILLRLGFLRWAAIPDREISMPSLAILARAFERIPEVAHGCFVMATRPSKWGFFWPAFLAAAFVLGRRGSGTERAVAFGALAMAAAYAAIFLFTEWDVMLHLTGAYDRLLEHVAPAAAVAMAAAASRLERPRGTL